MQDFLVIMEFDLFYFIIILKFCQSYSSPLGMLQNSPIFI